jgi:H+/Cl- antiporter ClcA
MEENAYIASIVAGAFYSVVSVRLIRLSRRTSERPELLLGLFFAFSGVYYLGYNLPSLLGFDTWSTSIDWAIEWAYVIGVVPYLFFVRIAFRPEETWAGVLVGICSAFMLIGTGVGSLTGHANFTVQSP